MFRQSFRPLSGSAEPDHWSECGRATSLAGSDALGHPHRSVLAFDGRRALRGGRDFFDHGWTQMHTDQDLSVSIRVHLWLYFLSALTRPLITVGSSAWSEEFGVYEPFDAEQGAAANPAFAFGFCHESQVCPASGRPGR